MNRTKLILFICMLGNVAAHGEVLLEPQTKTLSQSRDFTRTTSTASNSYMLVNDALATPRLSREWNIDHSNLLAGKEHAPNFLSASTMTPVPADFGPRGSADMWLVALASMGLISWQLWRKQKSLRFDQSCLAKDADYAMR